MYLAHSGAALAAEAADRRLPLAACLVAALAFDLTGVGHWLPFAAVLIVAAFAVGTTRWDRRAGLVLAATVASHDVLDLVVGVQLLPGAAFVGANLASRSVLELTLEFIAIIGGWLLYRGTLPVAVRMSAPAYGPLVLMLLFTIARFALDDQPSTVHDPKLAVIAVSAIGLLVTSAALLLADRRLRSSAARSSGRGGT